MNVLLATALFPPDVAPTATYVKELARRLSEHTQVTILAYTYLPEKIPGVDIIPVNKKLPLPFRLALFTAKLFFAARKADIVYVENGASVELPIAIISMLTRKPLFIHIGDKTADALAAKKPLLAHIQKFAKNQAREIITDTPLERPEILPFVSLPVKAQEDYQASWENHIKKLVEIFNHARR